MLSRTTIVIPCFNEALRFKTEPFEQALEQRFLSFIFVNDGSDDSTGSILKTFAERNRARVSFLDCESNRGKGESVRLGMLRALDSGAQIVGFWDADLSTPLSEILHLLHHLQVTHTAAVLGSRIRHLGTQIERKLWRHLCGRVFATYSSVALHLPVYDTQCGAKLFRSSPKLKEALSEPFHSRWLFDIELLGRLLTNGESSHALRTAEIVELPLVTWREVSGSKISVLSIPRILFEMARVWGILRDCRTRLKNEDPSVPIAEPLLEKKRNRKTA